MLLPLPELNLMPRSVRVAVLLTFSGWCCFLFATYAYYDIDSFFKFTIAGGLVCYYLYKGKRWARVMAMLSSVFIVLYGGFFAYLFSVGHNPIAMVVSIVNVVLFATSFYYLVIPETGRFFKKKDPPANDADGADEVEPKSSSKQDD